MTGRELREKLHRGERVYGSAMLLPSFWTLSGYQQLDLAFIDNEHCPLGRETTMTLCQLFQANGVVPIVRIPSPDPYLACSTVDAGARGIICPYMENVDEIKAMVGAVKYRPLKGEKLDQLLRDGTGINEITREYIDKKNENNILIANIESVPAMRRLKELVRVDGLDAVLIGPNDLSISLGIPDDFDNPIFIEAVEEIMTTARDAGIGAGVHFFPDHWERIQRYMDIGTNLIIYSSDLVEARIALDTKLSQLREAFGDQRKPDEKESVVV